MRAGDRCVYADLFVADGDEPPVVEFPPERGWPRQPYCRRHAIQVITTTGTPTTGKETTPVPSDQPNPNHLLGAIRASVAEVLADEYADEVARDLAEQVRQLDAWISGGGRLPLDWVANHDIDHPGATAPPHEGGDRR